MIGLASLVRKHHSRPLRAQADFFIRLKPRCLKPSQLPDPIPGANPRKPAGRQARDAQKYLSRRNATPVSRPLRASGMTTSPWLNRRVQDLRS